MLIFLDTITTVCLGLLVGTEFAVSVFINPVLWKLEAGAQARAISLFARRLGTAMPVWYAVSFLLILIETFVRRHGPGCLLLINAGAIWAVVIVLTLLFLVPINNRMTRLADSLPDEARRSHKKWDSLHRLRIAALAVSMICFLVGVRVCA
jgi:uncharacterized membrane protein